LKPFIVDYERAVGVSSGPPACGIPSMLISIAMLDVHIE